MSNFERIFGFKHNEIHTINPDHTYGLAVYLNGDFLYYSGYFPYVYGIYSAYSAVEEYGEVPISQVMYKFDQETQTPTNVIVSMSIPKEIVKMYI